MERIDSPKLAYSVARREHEKRRQQDRREARGAKAKAAAPRKVLRLMASAG